MKPARAAHGAPDPKQAIREQLGRILRSDTFQQADRLRHFLTFIVEEALAGRQSDLKEYVIGVQVFRKEDSFDPRTDPIVRVQARRLRAKLVRYFREEGRADALTIDLPKGGYAPLFKPRDTPVLVKRSIATSLLSRNALLVLPFTDHSPSPGLGSFCAALRDEVAHQLAQLPGLRVMTARRAEGDERGGTAAIELSGSVQRAGDRVRIWIRLVEGQSGGYIWSESLDADAGDPFKAQEQVAQLVVRKLEPELRAGRQVGGLRAPAENLTAQNLYLQGRYHLTQRTEEGLRKAAEFFERALAEVAQHAQAHSGLADAYGLLTHYGVRAPADVWSKAAAHAASAVMLDDASAEAHTSLAHVRATQDWDWPEAEREFQRAIALNPGYATAHHWYAISCLVPQGRLDEALDEMTAAQSLDPVSPIVARDLAAVHFYRRDFDTALEQSDHTIELNPHFAPAYWMLGIIQEQRRDFDESEAAFQRAVHLSPQTPRMHGALGRTFALSGRKRLAREALRKLEAFAGQRYVSPLEFAWIHFALGELEHGFRWLGKGFDDRSFDLIAMRVDPRFDALRDDDRFKALAARIRGPVGPRG